MSIEGVIGYFYWLSFWFTKDGRDYLFRPPAEDISKWTAFKCRLSGHKCGVVWYTSTGLEPDMHCKNCYDDLDEPL